LKPDVVVIGGGPAGSSAAIRLARSGRRVRLYEKARFPRPKLCGGFLSPESLADLENLEILGLLRQSGAIPVRRTVIVSPQGICVDSALPSPALSTSRLILDQLLLEQARRSGVDIIIGQDGFQDKSIREFTVVASGRLTHGPLIMRRKRLSPWYAGSETRCIGLQAFFRGVQGIGDQVELDLVEGGYVGLVRQQEGVNVCAMVTLETVAQQGPSLDRLLMHFMEENPALRSHINEATRSSDWMTVGPVRLGIRQLASGQTFYVGDAACVVDPFAGEGMAMGLYGSQLLMRALDQPGGSPQTAYERLWHQAFDPALRWNAVMRAIFSLPLFREPILHLLRWDPRGIQWLTELTRYRRIEAPS
jgi:flavin-dependent dehydrogenase